MKLLRYFLVLAATPFMAAAAGSCGTPPPPSPPSATACTDLKELILPGPPDCINGTTRCKALCEKEQPGCTCASIDCRETPGHGTCYCEKCTPADKPPPPPPPSSAACAGLRAGEHCTPEHNVAGYCCNVQRTLQCIAGATASCGCPDRRGFCGNACCPKGLACVQGACLPRTCPAGAVSLDVLSTAAKVPARAADSGCLPVPDPGSPAACYTDAPGNHSAAATMDVCKSGHIPGGFDSCTSYAGSCDQLCRSAGKGAGICAMKSCRSLSIPQVSAAGCGYPGYEDHPEYDVLCTCAGATDGGT